MCEFLNVAFTFPLFLVAREQISEKGFQQSVTLEIVRHIIVF